ERAFPGDFERDLFTRGDRVSHLEMLAANDFLSLFRREEDTVEIADHTTGKQRVRQFALHDIGGEEPGKLVAGRARGRRLVIPPRKLDIRVTHKTTLVVQLWLSSAR